MGLRVKPAMTEKNSKNKKLWQKKNKQRNYQSSRSVAILTS
jgi:hypothetical protein